MIGPGTYYLGIGEFQANVTAGERMTPKTLLFKHMMKPMTIDYKLRIFSSACYYHHKGISQWIHGGMQVILISYLHRKKF